MSFAEAHVRGQAIDAFVTVDVLGVSASFVDEAIHGGGGKAVFQAASDSLLGFGWQTYKTAE